MALAFVDDSNPVTGTASVTPDPVAAALQEGDHAFITVSYKQAGATLATPSGWTTLVSAQVGTGAVGVGVGPVQLRIYYRQVPSGGLTLPTLTMGGDATGRVVQAALIVYRGDLGTSSRIAFASTSGSDTTDDTTLSVTGAANIGIQTGDALLCYGAVTEDSSTTLSAQALSTPGVTYGSTGNPFNTGSGAVGDNVRSFASRAIATSGPSTGAPVFNATLGAATTGGALFLRLREIATETRRFYLANAAPAFTPGAAASFWNDTTPGLATPHRLSEDPAGAGASTQDTEAAATAGWFVLLGQWISAPADVAGAISGLSYEYTAGWLESEAAADLAPVIYVRVVDGVTGALRDEAISQFSTGREFPTGTPSAIGIATSDGRTAEFLAGDRIVLELGFRTGNAVTTPYSGSLYYGGTGTPDLADGVTDLNRPGWLDLQITPGVVFEETSQTVDGTAAAPLGFTATATGRRIVNGTAAATLGFTAVATGAPVVEGTASASLGFTASATGGPLVVGTASAALGFSATATGAPVVDGEATADLGFTATAEGIVIAPSTGTGAANLGFTVTAAGEVIDRVFGTATAALGFTAQATGQRTAIGTAQADLGFAAHVDGQVRDLIEGTGAADLGFAAHAAGRRVVDGTAAANLGFAASGAGEVHLPAIFGTAEADLGFTAAAAAVVDAALGVPFLPHELGAAGRLAVEVAWGADLGADASTWTWTDVTADVRQGSSISTKLGRDDEASTSQPATCALVLRNDGHKYSLGGRSPNWPYVRRNVPVRVRINPGDGLGFRSVFTGFADGFTPGWDALTGKIPTASLSASGTLRRLAQGDAPVMSAYRRAMLATPSVVHYWPFEEGKNATFAADLRGGTDMAIRAGQPDWDSSDDFDCSASLPSLSDGQFDADGLDTYVNTGENQVRFLTLLPDNGLPDGTVLAHIHTTGSIKRWDLTYEVQAGIPSIGLFRYFDDGATNLQGSDIIAFGINGVIGRLSLEMVQSGPDIDWLLGHKDARNTNDAGFFTGTVDSETVGIVSRIEINPHGTADMVFGHLTVQNRQTSLFEATGELLAHRGEFPSSGDLARSRMHRLCGENGVKFTRYLAGGAEEALGSWESMGPQVVAPLLTLLRECETCDQGQLWDGLDDGLSYSVRRLRESATLALTIDAAAGELAEEFDPVDDDQRNVNRAEATMLRAATAMYEDTNGPLGTNTIGIYDTSVEVNNGHDFMALHYAAWLVHLGTTQGYRFPSVTVDLRAAPHLAPAVLAVVPGHRIDVTNLGDVFEAFDIDTASLIVEGISHEISAVSWKVTFRCSPMSPWALGRVAAEAGDTDPLLARLDTDGSILTAPALTGATSLTVTSDPLPIANDTFTRTAVASWGSADVGGSYTLAGTAGTLSSDFSVSGGTGRMAVNARGRSQSAFLASLAVRDVDVAVTVTAPADVTGGLIELGDVMVRGTGFNDFWYARVTVIGDQSVGISIVEVVANIQTELVQQLVLPDLVFAGTLRVRMQAQGRTLRARVWNPAGAEPTDWPVEVTASAAPAGWVGVRVAVGDTNTNALPVLFQHDNLTVTTVDPPGGPPWTTEADDYPLTLDVGGVKVSATACTGATSPQTFTVEPLPVARPAGTPVSVWDPRPIGL